MTPKHPLGPAADHAYTLGPRGLPSLLDTLSDFARAAFPRQVAGEYRRRYGTMELARAARETTDNGAEMIWDGNKVIWQTDKDNGRAESREVQTWRNNGDGWDWELVDDAYVYL